MRSIGFWVLLFTSAVGMGVLAFFGKNPGAMPATAKRVRLLCAAAAIVVASTISILLFYKPST